MQEQFETLKSIEDEEDKLLLAGCQVKVLYYYQLWQMPFMGASFAYTMSNMLMFKKSLPRRLATSLAVGSLALSCHHYVGQYGL